MVSFRALMVCVCRRAVLSFVSVNVMRCCRCEGVDSLSMLAEVNMAGEFASSPGLKCEQEKLPCKRIQEATST